MSRLRSRLAAGQPTFGAFVTIMSPEVIEVLGTVAGRPLDWVVIDCQHFAHTSAALSAMIRTAELVELPTMVRVGRDDLTAAALALDLGAQGVVFPVVSSTEQAERLVDACRYPDAGTRSVGGLRGHLRGDASDGDPVIVFNIEDRAAMDDLDSIASVPGVDLLFAGPVDLARSYGWAPEDPRIEQLVMKVEQVAHDAGIGAMTYCGDPALAKAATARGVECVLVGTDYGLLRDRVAAVLAAAS